MLCSKNIRNEWESRKGDSSPLLPPMCVRAHACMHTYAHVHMHNLASIYNLPVEWQEYFLFDQGR